MSEPQQVNNYDGPVFHGPASGNVFAWNNDNVTLNQQNNTSVAPGFEALAQLVTDLRRRLPDAGLADADREDADAAAQEVLAEITGPDAPEPGRLRRALNGLKGALAPVATGAAAGATVGAQEWAQEAIRGLTGLL
ncbi:hypothetical protein JCM4814A_39350 [Streptomyces phaeofaciens JCM 4814]|uniref:Uncharacterized protein n=1 Tax=Streptomyces phaeofaciens TaxID=68254 RepID=A0A918HCH7_9ACTN|nr:hypothetical protein [Streptomyces phaeofaciens]GGT53362.1 hypothetical protein GCM10010226_33050 [Streptomyces phaeofaciens]